MPPRRAASAAPSGSGASPPAPQAGPSRLPSTSTNSRSTPSALPRRSARPPSLLQTAIIPPSSPLHAQAGTSTVTLSPARSPRPPHSSVSRSVNGTPSRPLSSTPKGAAGDGGLDSGGNGDPLGLRSRKGTRPTRPSSLGSFMSLPGRGEQLVPDGDDSSVAQEIAAAAAAEAEADEPTSWSLVDRLRLWRDDACTQHLYDTAAFWGGKVWLMTGDPNDAFWLAQVYFITGQFARAEKVLTGVRRPPSSPTGGGAGDLTTHDPGRSFADTFFQPTQEAGGEEANGNVEAGGEGFVRLTDYSVACRYLAAQCMVRQGKWAEALTLLGDINPFRLPSASGSSSKTRNNKDEGKDRGGGDEQGSADGGIKFEASLCHLRGVVHLHHKATERAKECFMEALALDVKSYESFEALVGGNMLEPEEEWEFISSLSYTTQTPDDAAFIKAVYTCRLKKYAPHLAAVQQSLRLLRDDYGMSDDPDVMFGLADFLFGSWRWADCYRITSRILALHDMHGPTLPLHLTCMYHLGHTRAALFVLAHELIDRDPDGAVSWYAAGLWYYAQRRWDECRRFFSKAAMLDTRFAPAWFGFGHSLALEGEHDQAITAYSTAQHNFQGTHLPLMFIGMQHILLANTSLANEYLEAAYAICKDDPLLLNERGVAAYYEDRFETALDCFEKALKLARIVQCGEVTWAPTYLNVCHCRRNLGQFDEAVAAGERALELDPRSAATLTALGMALQGLDQTQQAIEYYHQSLAILPADPVTTDLLALALERHAYLDIAQSPGTSFHYPGLPFAVGYTLDNEVDADDVEVGQFRHNPVVERQRRAEMMNALAQQAKEKDEAAARMRDRGTEDEMDDSEEAEPENENRAEDDSSMVMDD